MKCIFGAVRFFILLNYFYSYGYLLHFEPSCQLKMTVNESKVYRACFGVPYALPPLGYLRFRFPEIRNHINVNNNYTEEKLPCIGFNVKGQEDCLYLNIFTPILTNKNLPVIVWIPGLFFLNADTTFESNGPDFFIEQNVVFVTVSYRQGIFGFASTEDNVLPGNMGIADIFMALKWVAKFIKNFNGDVDNITVMAHGSGAVCVSILQQNALSKGLFHKLILQSGTSLATWGRSQHSRDFLFELGRKLKLKTDTTEILVHGLRFYSNVTHLQEVATKVYKKFLENINPLNGNILGPVSHNYSDFLIGPVHERFFQRNFTAVPTILGFTALEGINDNIQYMSGFVAETNRTNLYVTSIKADDFYQDSVASIIEEQYFEPGLNKTIIGSMGYVSDALFVKPILETSRLLSVSSPVYLYKFSRYGYFEMDMSYPKPGHEAELPYLFSRYRDYPVLPLNDSTRVSLIRFWSNFAKYGCPSQDKFNNFTWIKVNDVDDNAAYVNIDEKISLKINPSQENMDFFDILYLDYGNPPYDMF